MLRESEKQARRGNRNRRQDNRSPENAGSRLQNKNGPQRARQIFFLYSQIAICKIDN
jgi:hypothetical protein